MNEYAFLIIMVGSSGEDLSFIVATQAEWDSLENVDLNDEGIDNSFFDPFMADDTEQSNRHFGDLHGVFDYCFIHKLILKDGLDILVY